MNDLVMNEAFFVIKSFSIISEIAFERLFILFNDVIKFADVFIRHFLNELLD